MSSLRDPLAPSISSITPSTMLMLVSLPRKPSKNTWPFSLSRNDILLTAFSVFISIENECSSILLIVYIALNITVKKMMIKQPQQKI